MNARDALARIVEGADVLIVEGSTYLLTLVNAETMAFLTELETATEDAEDDDPGENDDPREDEDGPEGVEPDEESVQVAAAMASPGNGAVGMGLYSFDPPKGYKLLPWQPAWTS